MVVSPILNVVVVCMAPLPCVMPDVRRNFRRRKTRRRGSSNFRFRPKSGVFAENRPNSTKANRAVIAVVSLGHAFRSVLFCGRPATQDQVPAAPEGGLDVHAPGCGLQPDTQSEPARRCRRDGYDVSCDLRFAMQWKVANMGRLDGKVAAVTGGAS